MVLDEVEIILGSNITYTKRIVNMVFLHMFYYTSTGFLFLLFYFFLQFWVVFYTCCYIFISLFSFPGVDLPNGVVPDSKRSKFDDKVEPSSAKMYFHYYGQLLHQQNMLQDYVRTGYIMDLKSCFTFLSYIYNLDSSWRTVIRFSCCIVAVEYIIAIQVDFMI